MSGAERSELREAQLFARAYAECRQEMDSIPKRRVRAANLDVWRAWEQTARVLPQVMVLREEMLDQLPKFEIRWLDRLGQYARALIKAHMDFNDRTRRLASVTELVNRAEERYRVLHSDAVVLMHRGLVLPSAFAHLGERRGYAGLACDLLVVCGVLYDALPKAQGQSGVTEADLADAGALANQLFDAVAQRKEPLDARKQAAQRRDRAFTLFVTAYGQVRRAVQYLRWEHNDADKLMPSLYRRRHKRRGKPTVETPDVAAPDVAAPEASEVQATSTNEGWPFDASATKRPA